MGKGEFSRSVKEELARVSVGDPSAAFWEAHALLWFLSGTSPGRNRTLITEPFLLRRLHYLKKQGSGLHPSVRPKDTVQTGTRNVKTPPFPEMLGKDSSCRRAYLRGVFLARGYLAPPNKAHHLEMYLPQREDALFVRQLMLKEGLRGGLVQRRMQWIVYMKSGDHIVEFLKMVGASAALLRYEDIRIRKSLKNDTQRLVNMDRANVTRSVEASLRQLEHIRIIERERGFTGLPPALKELAKVRILNPSLSLEELGELLDPPVSKSAVNHRFRRLADIAHRLQAPKNKRRDPASESAPPTPTL